MELPKNSTGKFTQHKKNFPLEWKHQARFFPAKITADGIKPGIKDYYNEKNQKKFSDIDKPVFIDIERHITLRASYLFLDFDHILIDGKFVNENVARFVRNLITLCPNIYIEYSVSETGLHAFLKPSFDKFDTLVKTLYFTDSRDKGAPKLEITYKTNGKSCFLTGNKYETGGKCLEIPTNTIETLEDKVDDFVNNLLA